MNLIRNILLFLAIIAALSWLLSCNPTKRTYKHVQWIADENGKGIRCTWRDTIPER